MNKKISLLLPNLKAGGAEKVALLLANEFVAQGFNVDIVLLNATGELLPLLDKRIKVVDLQSAKLHQGLWPLINYLKSERPDILLALMWPLTILAVAAHKLSMLPGKVIVSDHSTYSQSYMLKHNRKMRWLFKYTVPVIYPLADLRLAVSNGVADDLSKSAKINRKSIKVIFNPVDLTTKQFTKQQFYNAWKGFEGKKIIAVGALKNEKNYPCLLRAFARLITKENAQLSIVGQGVLLEELELLTRKLNISSQVNFVGHSDMPSAWMNSADLLVLSSNTEGLPMVLIEALACGTPIVSTDCESGPREILDYGKYGKLVPVNDVDALAHAMLYSLQQKHNTKLLKKRAAEFSVKKIAAQYIEVFQ